MIRVLFVFCLVTAFAWPAFAQDTKSKTVEGALQAYFAGDADEGVAVLGKAGFEYERLLVAEMLPSEATVVAEVELAGDAKRLRYPVKLERSLVDGEARWRVGWAPVEAYARALLAVSGEGAGAQIPGGEVWADIRRVPAFPVIVSEQLFVTPFGQVPAEPADGATPEEQLVPPQKLVEHAQRWIGLLLEDDPAPAAVDLMVAPGASWTRTTQALMAPASQGLFKVYMIGQKDDRLVAATAAAPIFGQQSTPQGTAPLIVGVYKAEGGPGVRVKFGDTLVEGEATCGERMSFCATSLEEFRQQSANVVGEAVEKADARVAYVMLAATGDFEYAEVLPYFDALSGALGVPTGKIFMGYIAPDQK